MTATEPIVVKMSLAAGAKAPFRASEGAAGFDLHARLDAPVVIESGKTAAVGTGLSFAVPGGCEAQVRPRSGLAAKHGITVTNAPGTIDSDYRGEVKVILTNLGDMPFAVKDGDRIAQLVVQRVPDVRFEDLDAVDFSLLPTARGDGGFGSTGR